MPVSFHAQLSFGLVGAVLTLACAAAAPSDPGTGGTPAGGSAGSSGGAGGTPAGGTGSGGSGASGGSGGTPPELTWRCTDQPARSLGHSCTCVKDCGGACGLTECPSLPCCTLYTSTLGLPTTMCQCVAADHLALVSNTCATWATGNFCSLAKPCAGQQVSSCPP